MAATLTDPERLEEAIIESPRATWSAGGTTIARDLDVLVVEEPLEIRLANAPLAVVMRTPGADLDLATGFAITELIVAGPEDIERVSHCDQGEHADNVVRIVTRPQVDIDAKRFQRNLYSTSSCGICGKRSIEQAMREAPEMKANVTFEAATLCELPGRLREAQPVFAVTGGLHAAALSNQDGRLLHVREDIGRHNAVDKVVGAAARAGFDMGPACLVVSGRASYEVVQKALAARIPAVIAIGGVSSLAVELARRARMVLVGFARSGRLSIYAGAERIR